MAQIMSDLELKEKEYQLKLEYEKKILTSEYELKLSNLEIDLDAEREINRSINGNMEDYINFLEDKTVDDTNFSGWELVLGYAAGTLVTIGTVWALNSL